MQRGTIIRVFVASPGDIPAERDMICDLIDEWNHTHSERGVIVEAIRWETHSHAAAGDNPQKIINRQLLDKYDCDVLIAIFWSRLGTPTDTHDAGTLEEIEGFSERRGSKERVMLFFCRWPLPYNVDASQRDKVEAFRRDAEKWALCPTIDDKDKFKDVVRQNLNKVFAEIVESDAFKDTLPPTQPTPSQLCGQNLQRIYTTYCAQWAEAKDRDSEGGACIILRTMHSLLVDFVRNHESLVPHDARWRQLVQLRDDWEQCLRELPITTKMAFWPRGTMLFNELGGLAHAFQLTY